MEEKLKRPSGGTELPGDEVRKEQMKEIMAMLKMLSAQKLRVVYRFIKMLTG